MTKTSCFSHVLPHSKQAARKPVNHGPTLLIHGGAGKIVKKRIPCEEIPDDQKKEYLQAMKEALKVGCDILKRGGRAVDAVEAAIRVMEDCPLYNAGKGAVFTRSGKNELESSIMIGTPSHPAGAVTLLRTVKNPVVLAKTLMLDPDNYQVFLGGEGAEEYAKEKGLELVDPSYFWTEARWKEHLEGLGNEGKDEGKKRDGCCGDKSESDNADNSLPSYDDAVNERRTENNTKRELVGSNGDWFYMNSMGTVGAVAVDFDGVIAAATSTGGKNNKSDGRIGDSPLIGCGTWADNETCGVSGTGEGEFLIRYTLARGIASRMEHLNETVEQATSAMIDLLSKVGTEAGVVALDKYGNFTIQYNTSGMFRGFIRVSDEIPHAYIFPDDVDD
ncbi:10816_t:CDS:2 [Paraglomus brasilianum]|uniref:beta-aspartyl-peptidase n=1 Tax=Paraglomus brasilianum TaxID=144538 RepID=A0A9N8VG52_9GLOM|nr:10816_t:CDS:2 [Paraglomus brasilianum]